MRMVSVKPLFIRKEMAAGLSSLVSALTEMAPRSWRSDSNRAQSAEPAPLPCHGGSI